MRPRYSLMRLILGQPRRRQRGAVLLSIMMVMVVSMMIASALVNHFAVQETQGIEQLLAQVRADWAMIGHANYALGRAWETNVCGGTCSATDTDLIDGLEAVLIALRGPNTRAVWRYPTYRFEMSAADDGTIPALVDFGDANDGHIRLRLQLYEVTANGTPAYPFQQPASDDPTELLQRMTVEPLWYSLCVADLDNAGPPQASVNGPPIAQSCNRALSGGVAHDVTTQLTKFLITGVYRYSPP